ncbi:DUF4097 domain-containing protein [candidate division KSB1 bacterium]
MKVKFVNVISFCLLAALIFPLQAISQNNEIIVMDQRHVTKTYDFNDGGYLYVKNVTGDIKVDSWNRKNIEIDITKRGSRDDVEVVIDKRGNSFYVEVDYPDRDWRDKVFGRNNSASIHFNIKIPAKTELDLDNVTGDITISGINSRIEAGTVTGDLEIRDAEGNIYGKTTTGGITIFDIRGEVDAHSTTGRIEIRNTGDVDVHSTTGRIEVINSNGSNIMASITTGHIEIDLAKVDSRGRYEFKTTTGDIRLTIPKDAKADFTVKVKPKNLVSDFDLFDDRREKRSRRDDFSFDFSARTFRGDLNGGGARIYLSSSHGDVDIRKR